MFRKAVLACLTTALAAPAAGQSRTEDFTINVGTRDQNGICAVFLGGADNTELEISARAEDGNVNVAVHNIPSDWIDEEADPAIRLVADDGTVFESEGGAYRAGFTYRVMSFYDTTEQGLSVLSALKGGETFAATFDGHDAGTFRIQQTSDNITDYAYTWMQTCFENNGSSVAF